jgi:hypothetical protein
MDAPLFLARTQIACAEMLSRRELRNDRFGARDLTGTALDVAHRLLFGEFERRASRLLELVT